MERGRARAFLIAAAMAWCVVSPLAGMAQAPLPRTMGEASSWARMTSHVDMTGYLRQLQAATDRMLIREIGRSTEGRSIPAVFLGNPAIASPEGHLRSSGKPTVLVTGLMHGDEPAGKEAALLVIRELTVGASIHLLDSINVIVVPSVNPDGGMRNRRENASGYDLNRDWVALETPEVSAVLERLVVRYAPDVFLDVHNGGSPPYHLTFQTTLEPAADQDLVALARERIFSHVESSLSEGGMGAYWYSGPAFDDLTDTWYWRTTEPWPRKHHSYGGLRDMITVLYEIPESHPTRVAVAAASEGITALLEYVATHASEVRAAVDRARARTLEAPPTEVTLEIEASSYPAPESFYVLAPDPGGGPPRTQLVEGENRTRYVPTRTRSTPWGYILGAELHEAVGILERHGFQVERFEASGSVEVEEYVLEDAFFDEARYQGHRMLDVRVHPRSTVLDVQEGAFLIRVQQPGGRLIPQLLEPDAVDSLVRWNFLDEFVPPLDEPGNVLPLYRLMDLPGIPTRVL